MVYTLMRLGLFITSLLVVMGIWGALNDGKVPALWSVVLAFALSGVASYFLLNRQRDALARRVEERAGRASQRYETLRSREDQD